MKKYEVRSIESSDFNNIYNRIEHDFAKGEYAPYNVLYQQLKEGVQDGFILMEGEREVAYSICAESSINNYVLINLLAVFKGLRDSGYGSAFLEKFKNIYSDKNGLIVEVEKPEIAISNEDKVIREKRIQFYQKAGFYLLQDIYYSIWDIPMHLMVLPLRASKQVISEEIGQIIYEIYLELVGESYIYKMKFNKLNNPT